MARFCLSDEQWDNIPANVQFALRLPPAPRKRKPKKAKRIMSIIAKCSDSFSASLHTDGKKVGEYDGYVPIFMPGQLYGDYVQLKIDIDTGMIVNWNKPTQADLNKTFNLKP